MTLLLQKMFFLAQVCFFQYYWLALVQCSWLFSSAIEHLWDVVEREFRALDVHPTNLHQLQDAILSICANISKKML